jgi:hypothetical protein
MKRRRQKLIDLVDERKEFVLDVDGFLYYWPSPNLGHLSSCQLRWIADELDKRNKPWQDQIEKDFAALPEFNSAELTETNNDN